MRKLFVVASFGLLVSAQVSAGAREIVTETTKEVVSFTKDFFGGINEGVDEGRANTTSVDGAIVVTNLEEFEQHLLVEILTVESVAESNNLRVEVGFKNQSDKQVRIANLDDQGNVLLIDSDGYITRLTHVSRHLSELTIPAKAGQKHDFIFNADISKADKLRIWQKEMELAAVIDKQQN
ncbi:MULTISPECIES: hypothetical protein [unclassified Motilimonas]|uniref:hypothetical protein n=1 Tax=Motilimonas TaxID=1914248 RepID=UPI001E4A518E|nr:MULTISPECIES: hypothetical protein [unclassified Motilimonas]MCE0555941.1 hypothetical protein [Motilimonas sp. E26]MDO6528047.1 hypothetical protein [Motilimonas sp. 1_MG-2023]